MHRRARHLNIAGFGAAQVYDARFIQQANNTTVATWPNRVSPGTGDATMSNASFRPTLRTSGINGTSGVDFAGAGGRFMSMPASALGDLEIYVVGNHANLPWTGSFNNDLQAYIDQNHSGSGGFVIQTRPDLSSTRVTWDALPSSGAVAMTITATTTNIMTVSRILAGNLSTYVNGGNLTTVTNTQQWVRNTSQAIGYWIGGGSRYLQGQIGALAFFEKINSAPVRRRIEQALALSFKIQCS